MEWRQIAAARALLEREKGWVKREWGGSLPVALRSILPLPDRRSPAAPDSSAFAAGFKRLRDSAE